MRTPARKVRAFLLCSWSHYVSMHPNKSRPSLADICHDLDHSTNDRSFKS